MFSKEFIAFSEKLLEAYRDAGLRIVTAESCTGGLIAALLTEIAGSSDVVERGFVTYSNEAKMECLGVAEETLRAHGAVSAETAAAMALGALAQSRADVALSVTGIAGPGGGSPAKPVGLVWFGLARRGGCRTARHVFTGDRGAVRRAAVETGLSLLAEELTA
ncbi:MAG: CinA family protein [Rhodovibrionaceae bacterium]